MKRALFIVILSLLIFGCVQEVAEAPPEEIPDVTEEVEEVPEERPEEVSPEVNVTLPEEEPEENVTLPEEVIVIDNVRTAPNSIESIAVTLGTVPNEIMTRLGPRVKRVWLHS